MAHNKIKVAGQTPDKNGDITVNVEHLKKLKDSNVIKQKNYSK